MLTCVGVVVVCMDTEMDGVVVVRRHGHKRMGPLVQDESISLYVRCLLLLPTSHIYSDGINGL